MILGWYAESIAQLVPNLLPDLRQAVPCSSFIAVKQEPTTGSWVMLNLSVRRTLCTLSGFI